MKRFFSIALLALIMTAFSAALAQQAADKPLTRANWAAEIAFPPNLDAPKPAPGTVIDAANADSFAALIPEPVMLLVKKYKLRITAKDYAPYAPSDGYVTATRMNLGAAKLVDIGPSTKDVGIANYKGGLPFPKPQTGPEIAWDFYYAYHGDDGESEFGVYWISASRGVERHEVWRWTFIVNTTHRTDVAPIPRLAKLADKNIAATSITETLMPLDRKGQLALFNLFDNPTDREGWVYVPAQRRTMRFTSDNHGEAWNNTDLLYEDIRGYSGRPEWMNWKLLGKITMLAPMAAEVAVGRDISEKTYDFATWPHWNPNLKWQPRPVYVLEATPKLASYPYSKQILYVDAESFTVHAKYAYDKKGQPWKIMINATNLPGDPSKNPLQIATSFLVDLQAEHATVFPWYKSRANIGVNPDLFSLTTLRKNEK